MAFPRIPPLPRGSACFRNACLPQRSLSGHFQQLPLVSLKMRIRPVLVCVILVCLVASFSIFYTKSSRMFKAVSRDAVYASYNAPRTMSEKPVETVTSVPEEPKRIESEREEKPSASPAPLERMIDPSVRWKWNDGNDYDAIARAVLKRMNGGDEDSQPYYIIYNVDSTVGFANQFRSLCSLFLLAVASGRKFRINWGDYYEVTNSYFEELRYSRKEVEFMKFKGYNSFPRGVCNSTKFASRNVTQIFGNRNLSFHILSDLSCVVLDNPKYMEVLRRLGFRIAEAGSGFHDITYGEAHRLIRGQVARLLLTPNAEISQAIADNLKRFERRPAIGVQLRMGGSVSKTIENHRFLRISSLPFADEEIENALKYLKVDKRNTTLFVTTDSGIVRNRMLQMYTSMNAIQATGYAIGHSSAYFAGGNTHLTYLKRAIMDLVLMSQCDYIIYTRGSSYGQLAMRLGLNTPSRDLCHSNICSPFVY